MKLYIKMAVLSDDDQEIAKRESWVHRFDKRDISGISGILKMWVDETLTILRAKIKPRK